MAPGLFATEMTTGIKTLESGGQNRPEDLSSVHKNPAGRVGIEDDMAQAVLMLACNLFVTGVIVPVDGGFVTA